MFSTIDNGACNLTWSHSKGLHSSLRLQLEPFLSFALLLTPKVLICSNLPVCFRPGVQDTSYFGDRPDTFVSLADMYLVVEDERYPAHSQFVASCSRLIYHIIEDTANFSRQEPLIISSPLQGYKHADVQRFLKHVYTVCVARSNTEALQLLTVADQFDSPTLMERAITFLERAGQGAFLQADCGPTGVLHWLQLAERFNLTAFKQRCVNYAAEHFQDVKGDPRMLQLQADTSLAFMEALQKIDLHHIKMNSEVIERRGLITGQVILPRTQHHYDNFKEQPSKQCQSYYCCSSCPGHMVVWSVGTDYERKPKVTLDDKCEPYKALCQSMYPKHPALGSRYNGPGLAAVPQNTQELVAFLQQINAPREV